MAKLRISKIDAARRQIDSAIGLLFEGGDPVAVHTLACAGWRILRDLCEKRGTPAHLANKMLIRPGMEQKFWARLSRAANFFKHADRDADEILDTVEEEANDVVLFMATQSYVDLGYQLTAEMETLCTWFIVMNPDLMRDDLPAHMLMAIRSSSDDWHNSSRGERLNVGKELLRTNSLASRSAMAQSRA